MHRPSDRRAYLELERNWGPRCKTRIKPGVRHIVEAFDELKYRVIHLLGFGSEEASPQVME